MLSPEVIELDDDGWQVLPEVFIEGASDRKSSNTNIETIDIDIEVDENGWQVFPGSRSKVTHTQRKGHSTPSGPVPVSSADIWPIFQAKAHDKPKEIQSSNGSLGASAIASRREFWNTPAPSFTSTSSSSRSIPASTWTPSSSSSIPASTWTPYNSSSIPALPVAKRKKPTSPVRSGPLTVIDPGQKPGVKPTSVIDPAWELLDPNPDVHALFLLFNASYFYDALGMVTVEWSSKMTTCAGICYFKKVGRLSEISIKLSLPLLKLRPRKDLVETLLHEMIHAYLFLQPGHGVEHDRDGHGPNFQEHMHRINKTSGSKITIYHSFHDEVGHYKQHWWQCNGPCRHRHPFYGLVKRAMNRAPGPSDRWWSDHGANCDGVFVKVKEPPKVEKADKKKKNPPTATLTSFGFTSSKVEH